MGLGMELRIIAAASLVALAAQGCYRPMYSSPYGGYPSQGYPVGSGYPGSFQTPAGQPYVPSTMPPTGAPMGGGSIPTYGTPYNPGAGGPSANSSVVVPNPRDAAQFQPPETSGGRELGFNPGANDFLRTAGTAPRAAEPNPFAANNAAPIAAQPTFADPSPTPATVTSDNFTGGNSPTRLQ
jgi:hypothetical protein